LESLRLLVEPANSEGPSPLNSEDYQDLVNLVLEFPDSYRRVIDSELRRVFTERKRSVEQLQQVRSDLTEMADRYTTMVRNVEEDTVLRALAGKHPLLQGTLAKLEEAVAALKRDRMRLIKEWPVCNTEELAGVPTEREQGLVKPVDQAFAEMKGIAVDELHHRLEEHKARRKEYGWE